MARNRTQRSSRTGETNSSTPTDKAAANFWSVAARGVDCPFSRFRYPIRVSSAARASSSCVCPLASRNRRRFLAMTSDPMVHLLRVIIYKYTDIVNMTITLVLPAVNCFMLVGRGSWCFSGARFPSWSDQPGRTDRSSSRACADACSFQQGRAAARLRGRFRACLGGCFGGLGGGFFGCLFG